MILELKENSREQGLLLEKILGPVTALLVLMPQYFNTEFFFYSIYETFITVFITIFEKYDVIL